MTRDLPARRNRGRRLRWAAAVVVAAGLIAAPFTATGAGASTASAATVATASAATASGPAVRASIPTPDATQIVISVKVAGDRLPGETTMSSVDATGVAGVTLRLSASSTDPVGWVTWPWATCTSDAQGDCNFVVPVTTAATSVAGMNVNQRPWVHQVSATAGSGWNLMQTPLALEAGPPFSYQYRLDTTVTAGSTYRSTTFTPFMKPIADPPGNDYAASHGRWTVVRDNPPLATRCGLDLAVVMDLSASIGAAMPAAHAAVDTLIDNLVGTPSNVALFNFSTTSPRSGLVNHPQLMSVRTTSAASTVKALYAGWSALGQTNWDQGLARVAEATPSYDAVVFLTDGLPTTHSVPPVSGWGWINIRSLEAGVFSANLVKSEDTRVVSLFVSGTTPTAAQLNDIRAISGPTAGSDYFVSSDYTQAAQQLAAFAKGNCRSTVNIEKRIVEEGVDASGMSKAQLDAVSAPAADWVFDAEATSPVTIDGASSYTTGADGRVTVPLNFIDPFISGPIEVTEQQQPAHTLVPVEGSNAHCVDANTGLPVAVTDVGSPTSPNPGFSAIAEANIALDCVVYNQQTPSHLTLVKQVGYGAEPADSWTLTATGPAGAIAGPTGTTSVSGPVSALAPYQLSESGGPDTYVQVGAWSCALTDDAASEVPVVDGAVAVPAGQDVTCTVTNSTATLTILKHVLDPEPGFEADAWELTATPASLAGGTLQPQTRPGAETDVAGANTLEVRPGHTYTLSEQAIPGTPLSYQVRLERFDGTDWVEIDSAEIVAPEAGQQAVYRFVNARIPTVTLPMTGGSGPGPFVIAGGCLLALAAAAALWDVRRRRSAA